MKNKKASDRLGWKAKWIKGRGEEMVKSLYILFNRVKTENQIPKQWQLTTVESIYKGGDKENIQENQRGIFLVNTVPKIYESALKTQNENRNENMSHIQIAERKQRSTVDSLIILNSIIENQMQNENKTCLLFANAKKCFDKLWLKDCLIELYNLGYSPSTIRNLYETNKTLYRSSRPEVFLKKGVLKICSKFIGEHPCRSVISIKFLFLIICSKFTREYPCRSVISIKLLRNFIEIALWYGCSPINLMHIFRTPFLKNISGWLLIIFQKKHVANLINFIEMSLRGTVL